MSALAELINQIKSNQELTSVLINARVCVHTYIYIYINIYINKREQTYRIKRLVQGVWNHRILMYYSCVIKYPLVVRKSAQRSKGVPPFFSRLPKP